MSSPVSYARTREIVIQSGATLTTTTGYTFTIPDGAEAGIFVFTSSTPTGTSPTIDGAVQISPDNGTTWITVCRNAQVTANNTGRTLSVSFKGRHSGEAAAEAGLAATGGASANNFVASSVCRYLFTVGGTNPGFPSVKAWVLVRSVK